LTQFVGHKDDFRGIQKNQKKKKSNTEQHGGKQRAKEVENVFVGHLID
jgi:hypothetical protein